MLIAGDQRFGQRWAYNKQRFLQPPYAYHLPNLHRGRQQRLSDHDDRQSGWSEGKQHVSYTATGFPAAGDSLTGITLPINSGLG